MTQPNFRATHRGNDKANLETAVEQLIKDINFDEIGDKQLTPEQKELRDSYLRSHEVLKNAENIGYDFLHGDD